jgi:Flp pilus assembly protein TadG
MSFLRKAKTLSKQDSGAAAIEFAILALPFIILFVGILEVCLCFFYENTLVRGMEVAVREVRLGTNFDLNTFKTSVCNGAGVIPDCENALQVQLIETNAFTPVDAHAVCDENGSNTSSIVGNIATAETIVTAVGCFKWHLFTPLMRNFFQTYNDGTRVISVAAAFRTEPF